MAVGATYPPPGYEGRVPIPSHVLRPQPAWPGLLALGFVALVLRLLYATRSGIWRDEALGIAVARLPGVLDVLAFLRDHESHPPLFYLMLRGWAGLVGASDLALVVLPVALGVLLVPAAYWVGNRVFSRPAGWLAALLAATSPILTEHAALVRPYSWLPLLGLGMAYALWRGLLGSGWRPWAAFGGLTALALLTHNYAWVVLAGLDGVALIWLMVGDRRALGGLAAAHALAFAIFAPWLPAFVHQVLHAGHAPHPVSSPWIPLALVCKTFSSLPNAWAGGLVLAALLGLVAVAARRADGPTRLAYGIFVGAPLLVFLVSAAGSAYSDLLWPRTLLTVVPCLLVGAGGALAALVPPRGLGVLALAAAGVYAAIALTMLALPKSNAREIAAAVAARVQPTDLVVISPEWMAPGFNYYFSPANRQLDYPHDGREAITPFDDVAGRMADPAAFQRAKATFAAQHAAGGRVWVVLDHQAVFPDYPRGDELPTDLRRTHWNAVGLYRSAQLMGQLNALYGKPNKEIRSSGIQASAESYVAFLFAP
ncbi:MAG: hypothetical protein JWM80_33 [Cyanobacteria bacterium RYN_339]|nr:hypothetical protein [Cyanobacteria bacterium RYN_339]